MPSPAILPTARRHFWLKMVGHCLAIPGFLAVYLLVGANPMFPVTLMPALALDEWTPLWPWTVWIYFSLWVYICLPAMFMGEKRELWLYFLGALLMAVVGLTIFLYWPTATAYQLQDWSGYPATLTFMKDEDYSRNACPSLHVAYAVWTALWLRLLLRRAGAGSGWQIGNVLWAVLIILSTLTTKQHVVIDLAAGATLGGLIFAINRYWVRRAERLA